MQDFNDYVKNGGGNSKNNNSYNDKNGSYDNIMNMVSGLAGKFDGKNQNDLMRAVYEEAKKGKMNGTLKNSDLDNFTLMLSPMLDNNQRKMLNRVVAELKKI